VPCDGETRQPRRISPRSLAWSVAADLDRLIPVGDLVKTVQYAIRGELAADRQRDIAARRETDTWYGLLHHIARTLDWLIRHNPRQASRIIGELAGDAERDLNIPRSVTLATLWTALGLDGKLDGATLDDFLSHIIVDRSIHLTI